MKKGEIDKRNYGITNYNVVDEVADEINTAPGAESNYSNISFEKQDLSTRITNFIITAVVIGFILFILFTIFGHNLFK